MALKSIFEIEVNDEAFKRFNAVFAEYRSKLAEMPDEWKKIQAASSAALLSQDELMKKRRSEEDEDDRRDRDRSDRKNASLSGAEKMWQRAAGFGKALQESVSSITGNLFRWQTLAGVLGGLGGLGGGGALADMLIRSGTAQGRTAAGLGSSPGDVSAFAKVYGPTLGGDAAAEEALRATKTAMTTAAGQRVFASRGIQTRNRSPQDVWIDTLESFQKQFAGKLDSNTLTDQISAWHGGDVGITGELLRQFKGQDLSARRTEYGQAQKTLGELTPELAAKLMDVTRALGLLEGEIETKFIVALANWSGHLQGFTEWFGRFLDPSQNDAAKKQLGSALGDWADQDWKASKDWISDLAGANKLPGFIGMPSGGGKATTDKFPGLTGMPSGGGARFGKVTIDNLLDSIEWVESHGNPRANSGKAQGAFQFTPGTAKAYGLKDPFDPVASREAARHYLQDLIREFGGNLNKVIEGYNTTPGRVRSGNLLPETQNYLAKVLAELSRVLQGNGSLGKTRVDITQPAGSNLNASILTTGPGQ